MKIKEIPLHTSNDFILNSSVNVTFYELFSMNYKKFEKWKKDLQKVIYESWVIHGEPPMIAGDEQTIINQFQNLVDKKDAVSIVRDELTFEEHCVVPGVVVSGANYFFPNRAKMQDFNTNDEAGESLWKVFVEEPDSHQTEIILRRLDRQLKNDGTFEFAPKVMIGDKHDLGCTNAFHWVLEWQKNPIEGYDFFLDGSNPVKGSKSKVLAMGAKPKVGSNDIIGEDLGELVANGFIKENQMRFHSFEKLDASKPVVIRLYRKDQRVFPKAFDILRKSVAMGGNFPSSVAKFLYEKYTTPNTDNIIYDSSSGYGGRLVGALSVCKDRQIHYVGTDPNPDHFLDSYGISRYKYLQNFFQSSIRSKYKTTTDIFDVGSEEIHKEKRFQKYKGKVDFFFTSPPYFSAEGYSDDENQSYKKFPDYHLWRDGFLKPTLVTAVEWLKSGGHLAWNVADVAYGARAEAWQTRQGKSRAVQQYIPLEYDSIEILKSLGMKYETTWKMVLSGGIQGNKIREWTRKPSTRNFVQIKSTPRKVELIYVWRKP